MTISITLDVNGASHSLDPSTRKSPWRWRCATGWG